MPKFPPLRNDRILRAAKGEIPDKLPIWVMRQAGRYLPEFIELKKHHTFFEICQNPKLACEATLMPIRRYNLDAAIIFSDILVIPQALGMIVEMKTGVGPLLPIPLKIDTIEHLNTEGVIDRLKYVGDAITLTRHRLEGQVPLFGFSGAPWTLMAYMVEGGGSKTFSRAKKWLYICSIASHRLLQLLTDVIVDYLVMQVESGAQILQVFDSNADLLNKKLYAEFCLPYLKEIRDKIKQKLQEKKLDQVPMVLFAKGAHYCLPELADLGYEVLGIDWTIDPAAAKELLTGKNVTIQGNLDPCALFANEEDLTKLVQDMIKEFGTERYIVNLGHGIYPDTPVESLQTFVEVVHGIEI